MKGNIMDKPVDKVEPELFQCPACGLHYKSKEVRNRCKRWCEKNNSCNIEIIKDSEESKNNTKKS